MLNKNSEFVLLDFLSSRRMENSVMKCNFNRMKLYEEISAFRLPIT